MLTLPAALQLFLEIRNPNSITLNCSFEILPTLSGFQFFLQNFFTNMLKLFLNMKAVKSFLYAANFVYFGQINSKQCKLLNNDDKME